MQEKKASNFPLDKWLGLPGNEIWANLKLQKALPGMNQKTFEVERPVAVAFKPPSPDEEKVGRTGGAGPEENPPTMDRQWRPPVSYVREQNPAVEMMTWPMHIITVQADAANVVRRIPVPPGVSIVRFSGTGGNPGTMLISTNRFVLPLPAISADVVDYLAAGVGPMALDATYWECQSISQFFLGFTVAGAVISASFWAGYSPRTPSSDTK